MVKIRITINMLNGLQEVGAAGRAPEWGFRCLPKEQGRRKACPA